MIPTHDYIKDCPCDDCLRITFAAGFGREQEHELMTGGPQLGNVSTEHEVIGSPQAKGPRSSWYGG